MRLKTYLICRIIFTFLFLIISTTMWFKKEMNIYHQIDSKLKSNEIVITNLKKLSENESKVYNLKIENKDNTKQKVKVYIVPDAISNSISNNYIKYQINDSSIKTLNMDGMIIIDSIDSLESLEYNLKLWISDTYLGDSNYLGRVIVL